MDYPSVGQSAREASPITARAILKNEWPYLLVLVFALFGVAYTSLSRSPMAIYWIVLAPVIGVICVVSRWREISGKDDRLRLLWTQALHWAAVLLAMHLMFVADVARMMNADATSCHGGLVLSGSSLGSAFPGLRGSNSPRSSSYWWSWLSSRSSRHWSGAAARTACRRSECRRRRLNPDIATVPPRTPACRAAWLRRADADRAATRR